MSENHTRINVNFDELQEAADEAGMTMEQTELVWNHLKANQPKTASRSAFANVLFYVGAAVTLVPMAWLLDLVTRTSGASGSLGLSIFYAAIFALAGERLASKENMRVGAGLLYVLATSMTPFIVAAIETLAWGGKADTTGAFAIAAVATLLVGNFMTARSRISFVCFPALIAGVVATELLSELFFGYSRWEHFSWALTAYGIVTCIVSFGIDRRSTEDYAFWGYGVGAISLGFGLAALGNFEFGNWLYLLAGVVFMFTSVVLSRAVFGILGGLAVVFFCVHLLEGWLGNSIAFLGVLTLIGGALIAFGVFYATNAEKIKNAARKFVPKSIRPGLPKDEDEE